LAVQYEKLKPYHVLPLFRNCTMPRAKSKPRYSLHKPSGRARVRINGRDHYLGAYQSPESFAEYDKLIDEYLRTTRTTRSTITIDLLCLKYIDFADTYYRHADGSPTGTVENIRAALKPLVRIYGRTLAGDFSPLKLKAVRDEMIKAKLCRTNINRHIQRIKGAFSWAMSEELVAPAVHHGLTAVPWFGCRPF
jgi:hypothetical protein